MGAHRNDCENCCGPCFFCLGKTPGAKTATLSGLANGSGPGTCDGCDAQNGFAFPCILSSPGEIAPFLGFAPDACVYRGGGLSSPDVCPNQPYGPYYLDVWLLYFSDHMYAYIGLGGASQLSMGFVLEGLSAPYDCDMPRTLGAVFPTAGFCDSSGASLLVT